MTPAQNFDLFGEFSPFTRDQNSIQPTADDTKPPTEGNVLRRSILATAGGREDNYSALQIIRILRVAYFAPAQSGEEATCVR